MPFSNWTVLGTHTGTAFYDVEPSGEPVVINGTAILRMRDGKIVEIGADPIVRPASAAPTEAASRSIPRRYSAYTSRRRRRDRHEADRGYPRERFPGDGCAPGATGCRRRHSWSWGRVSTLARVLRNSKYQECLGLLRRSWLGRLAVVLDAQPLVFPANFTLDDTAVVFRTNQGTKLLAARESDVAFECDDIDRTYHTGWSVLVTGRAEQVHDPTEIARLAQLPLGSWSQGPKPIWMRLAPRTITGRRIPLAAQVPNRPAPQHHPTDRPTQSSAGVGHRTRTANPTHTSPTMRLRGATRPRSRTVSRSRGSGTARRGPPER
jgi:hypothetical protein